LFIFARLFFIVLLIRTIVVLSKLQIRAANPTFPKILGCVINALFVGMNAEEFILVMVAMHRDAGDK
jgi:hypothetical protein